MTGSRSLSIVMLALLLIVPQQRASAQTPAPASAPATAAAAARPAVPLDAVTAVLDAFRQHALVGIGDAHGDRQGEAFQLALVRDLRFAALVNDIVMESGNSRHQAVVDKFVRGEEVPPDALRRAWLDTTQQVVSLEVPELVTAVRRVNASLAPDRRLRVLLGEPPIDWERIRTSDELRQWEASPEANRDAFVVDLIRREVLAKNRRALLLYGAGHLFRKVINQSIVTLFESGQMQGAQAAQVKMTVLTIWTNAAAEMSTMQADVAKWSAPSLAYLRGTTLGQVGLSDYFGPGGQDIPPQWRAPMEEQFDAVLYLGPLATITLARPQPWPCAEPALPERLRRLGLLRPAIAERAKQDCLR